MLRARARHPSTQSVYVGGRGLLCGFCVKVVEKRFIVSLYEHYRGQPMVVLVK